MASETPARINRRLLPVRDAIEYLGIGRSTLYKLIDSGAIPTVPIGSRTLFDIDDLDAYIERTKGTAS